MSYAPPAGYGATPTALRTEPLKEELDYRLGLWRAARNKPHERQAVLYIIALIKPYYPADHPRIKFWESKLVEVARG